MPLLYLPPPLRPLAGGISPIPVEGATVGEALLDADRRFPGLLDRLTLDGEPRPGLQVCVDDVLTRQGLRAPLRPGSEIHFLPPIGGG